MYKNKKISLVMPCYNEEKGVEEILKNKPSFIDEVIVVDNNSNDKTLDTAKNYGATVLHLAKRGYGLAYQVGLSKTSGDIIIMIDGGNSYPIYNVERFLIYMERENYDFLTGCRSPLIDKKTMPFIKRISNHFISWLIRTCFHIDLVGSQSGMFVFKSALLPKIIPLNSGMGFTHEIKLKTWLNPQIRSSELYINYQKRIGKVKYRPIRDGIKTFYDMITFLWSYNKNRGLKIRL